MALYIYMKLFHISSFELPQAPYGNRQGKNATYNKMMKNDKPR